jgi:hypothetical protein
MKTKDNELLIIQTSDSSSIFVTKELFPYDDSEIEEICYSICEGHNPIYWLDNYYTDLHEVINLLEFPKQNISCKRDYISWWLNCKPSFVDESVKLILKKRLEVYHLTGEIKNTFRNTKYGLEFNSDCLLEWHKLLNVEYNNKLLELIPKDKNSIYNEIITFNIYFEGFKYLPYSRITLKKDAFSTFQNFLDYIYVMIRNEVSQFSYGEQWILFNTLSGLILQKNNSNGMLINHNDKIICYKK